MRSQLLTSERQKHYTLVVYCYRWCQHGVCPFGEWRLMTVQFRVEGGRGFTLYEACFRYMTQISAFNQNDAACFTHSHRKFACTDKGRNRLQERPLLGGSPSLKCCPRVARTMTTFWQSRWSSSRQPRSLAARTRRNRKLRSPARWTSAASLRRLHLQITYTDQHRFGWQRNMQPAQAKREVGESACGRSCAASLLKVKVTSGRMRVKASQGALACLPSLRGSTEQCL